MIEDESEVFEITDFTTASEWERFIARLEEIIHEWKLSHHHGASPLSKGDLTNGTWTEKIEHLQFADFKFIITRRRLQSKDDTEDRGPSGDPRDSSVESNYEQVIITTDILNISLSYISISAMFQIKAGSNRVVWVG